MKIETEILLPVRTDKFGCYIFDSEGKVLAQIRGFGWIKHLVGEDEAHGVQKEMADWLVDRINGRGRNGHAINRVDTV